MVVQGDRPKCGHRPGAIAEVVGPSVYRYASNPTHLTRALEHKHPETARLLIAALCFVLTAFE
jgi:hypothetical protein